MSSGKIMIIRLIVGYIKKHSRKMRQNFPQPFSHSKCKIKVEIDLSTYAIKFREATIDA